MFMMEKCLETPEIEVISRHLAVQNSKNFGGCAPWPPWGTYSAPRPPAAWARSAETASIIGVHGVWNVYCLLKLGCTDKNLGCSHRIPLKTSGCTCHPFQTGSLLGEVKWISWFASLEKKSDPGPVYFFDIWTLPGRNLFLFFIFN